LNLQVGGILNMADTARRLNLKMAKSLNVAAFVNLQDDRIFKYGGKFKY
jgi:hypothetical protein